MQEYPTTITIDHSANKEEVVETLSTGDYGLLEPDDGVEEATVLGHEELGDTYIQVTDDKLTLFYEQKTDDDWRSYVGQELESATQGRQPRYLDDLLLNPENDAGQYYDEAVDEVETVLGHADVETGIRDGRSL